MDVRAEGPHRVGSLLFVTAAGTYARAIVAKATFILAPEASPLVLDGGDPLFVEDLRWEDDPQYSLRAASDLVPFKRSPEVLVTGSAHAPGGKPVKVARVRVAIGTLDKTVEVQGDRCFGPDGSLSEPAPWTRMPLVWERAAGGPGTSNPVGILTGPDSYPDAWGRVFLPNLAAPWTMVSHLGETLSPAGLGPLAGDSHDRARHLSRGLSWDRPLPADFDGSYFNAAPQDQWIAELTGNETLTLENLHPRYPRLVTKLASATPVAMVEVPGRAPFVVGLGADTLWIDADRGVATLTFRGHVAQQTAHDRGSIVVRPMVDPRKSASERAAARPPSRPPAGRRETVEIVVPPPAETGLHPALSGTGRQKAISETGRHQAISETGRHQAISETGRHQAISETGKQQAISETGRHAAVGRQETVELVMGQIPAETWGFGALTPVAAATAQADTIGERMVAAQAQLAPSLVAKAPVLEPFVPAPTAASEPVAPPPLWKGAPIDDATEDAPDTSRTPAPPEAPPVPEPPPPSPTEKYPLIRCARIQASLDLRPADADTILTEESLDPDAWADVRQQWEAAIEKELSRHKNKLLRDQDAAYVGRIEEERAPIAASDYAKMAAAAEVGELDRALSDLHLPAAAWPRIRRVWIQLLAKDRKLASLVQSFLDDERSK